LVLQVKDISLLSPFAEYTWWDDQSGLKDGTLLGSWGLVLANIWVACGLSTVDRPEN
jgi:hypothetical protein